MAVVLRIKQTCACATCLHISSAVIGDIIARPPVAGFGSLAFAPATSAQRLWSFAPPRASRLPAVPPPRFRKWVRQSSKLCLFFVRASILRVGRGGAALRQAFRRARATRFGRRHAWLRCGLCGRIFKAGNATSEPPSAVPLAVIERGLLGRRCCGNSRPRLASAPSGAGAALGRDGTQHNAPTFLEIPALSALVR